MDRRWRGFTLVELIVVIAVIGILATVSVIGFSRFQADTRDATRKTSVATIAEALEKYYDKNGEYPGCADLQQSAGVVANDVLPGLQASVLSAPQSPSGQSNSLQCATLTPEGVDFFEYSGDGSQTCATGDSCLAYTIKYKEEGSNSIQSVESRRQTSFATANQPVLTAGTITASTVNLSWTEVSNASGYKVQRATNSAFTANLAEQSVSSTSYVFGGLNPTTQYYFRVVGLSGSTEGTWSNTVNATTTAANPPTLVCSTIVSATQMTITWNAVPGATSYRLERSTNASFSPTTVVNATIAGTSQAATGLTLGTLYYWRAQTTSGSATSAWSATCLGGPVLAPTSLAASTPTCGQIDLTWTASTGATSYDYEVSTSASFTSPNTGNLPAGSSGNITNVFQGTTNYVRMYAKLGSAVSAASATVTGSPSFCQPPPYTISSSNDGSSLFATSNAVCPAGSTANYQWYANGGAWVAGDQYQNVGYTPGYGQGITLTVNTRCYNSNGNGPWTGASNSAAFTRGVPSPYLNPLVKGSGTRRINASWSNICNGYHELYLTQGSFTQHTTPLISGVSSPYSLTDTRVWNSTGTANYLVRVQCNGVFSGWSNQQSRAPS